MIFELIFLCVLRVYTSILRREEVGTRRSVILETFAEQQQHYFTARNFDVSQNSTFEHYSTPDVLSAGASMPDP
jgi:hypothetical protein